MFAFIRDLKYGLRVLLRKPVFTLMIVVTFGLGIGANTAIFTFVNAILLQPVPFPNSNQLVMAWATRANTTQSRVTIANYLDWAKRSQVFTGLETYKTWVVNLVASGEPDRLIGDRVSPQFFQTLGAKFTLGRGFLPREGKPGQDREAVLSYGLWQRAFGARTDIVGRSINLDGADYQVVGVLAANFEWPSSADIWAPLVLTNTEQQDRTIHSLYVVGRLKPTVSLAQAQSQMDIIVKGLAVQYPQTNIGEGISLVRLPGQFGDSITKAFVLLLMGAVSFVLLIACSNAANLLLADATRRQREVAVRTVLGASRTEIVLQSLTESTLLSCFGGGLGLLIAFWGVGLLRGMIPPDQLRYIPGWGQMHLSGRGFLFALICALIAGFVSGIAPALQASKPELSGSLKEGGWGATVGRSSRLSQSSLIATEFALSLILLVGTGLMIKGFGRIADVQKLGFDGENVLTTSVRVQGEMTPRQMASFYRQALERIQALPGVQQAGVVTSLPFTGGAGVGLFAIEGRPAVRSAEMPRAALEIASQGYFPVMRIPLLTGRTFSQRDDEGFLPVAVLSKSAAHEYWPSQNPIGARIRLGPPDSKAPWLTVVGVVGDVKEFWLDKVPQPTLYTHYLQSPYAGSEIVVRTSGAPLLLAPAVRNEIHGLDTTASVFGMKSMPEVMHEMMAGIRVSTGLMAVFGAIAMLLAIAGVYGMIAYTVSSRQREIGIRMALGAQPREVVGLFVQRAVKLAAIGLGVGLPAAFALTRVMSNTLFGVVTLDPLTFLIFVVTLVIAATVAAYVPARRATRVDALIALRYE